MLEELSKEDLKWRNIAYSICKCKSLADDLVNDMYVKLADKTEINNSYVYRTIYNLFLDHVKENKKTISIEQIFTLKQNDNNDTERRFELLDMLKDLPFFQREVLLQTHEKSLRDCEKDTGVSYAVFHYHKNKALNKLKKKYNGRTER